MFELFIYVYSCSALSARFFAVDRALNSYFMIMIMIIYYIFNFIRRDQNDSSKTIIRKKTT